MNKRAFVAVMGLFCLGQLVGQIRHPWPQSLLDDLSNIPSVSGTPAVFKALCPDPELFREVWERDAGTDASGRLVKVARLARIAGDVKAVQCDDCHLTAETWAVAISPDGSVEKQLMEEDPYADRQDMDPESPGNLPGFKISANRLAITTQSSRGSWGGSTEWQLFPKKVLHETWEHHIPAGGADTNPPFFEASWDWSTLTGSGAQQVEQPCPHPQGEAGQFLFIPLLPLGQDFIQTTWKTGLGKNALAVNGDNAFLLWGKRMTGPVMRLELASPTDLFIELPKTAFVTNVKDWLASDHLELWQVEGVDYEPEFPDVQWGIQLGDGQVFPAHGNPKQMPLVEKVVRTTPGQPPATVLHIRLAYPVGDFGFLTVSYSASDTGKKVASLVSTSQLCFGRGETLGLVKKIDFAEAQDANMIGGNRQAN